MKINTCTLKNTYDDLNKDSFIVKDNWFVVADGVSSHGVAGAEASQMATDIVKDTDISTLKSKKYVRDFMFDLEKKISSNCDGSTTFTSAFIKNNKLVLAHTGDSECYIVYEDNIKEITKPFCATYSLYTSGKMTLQEIKRARGSNILLECLGGGLVNPQIEVFDLADAKGLILCSDGANYVLPEHMLEIFRLYGDSAAQRICEEARQAGSSDDITVICVQL